ncbi:DgyrCDS4579 [Dimorphilus gyrociliatus]|uniref:S-adenosylmethionine sensor upstream of mTORC1 n=1 Tax=Dimorphilus gyrociliatus TaxID=2664684 RepID=A0A7I8VHX9_9ANNE|nr:DgyrCDS4579 [Dimorphilus gyrociliatus]
MSEHQNLSSVIKETHAKLRKMFNEKDSKSHELLWAEHCSKEEVLNEYATAMKDLATKHWSKSPYTRINWCIDKMKEYFFEGGLEKLRMKDERRLKHHGMTQDNENILIENCLKLPLEEKVRLLDVGSCYNPFESYNFVNCLPIDLCPASPTVRRCDFLQVPISEGLTEYEDTISCLCKENFDVVVFSLLLEYFPSSEQRHICCEKAYEVLKGDGLLVIITPDSSHQNKNMNMIKSWKLAMENLGFTRWRYEKLQHLHCMAYRKFGKKRVFSDNYKLLFIPQDSRKEELSNSKPNLSLAISTG